MSELSKDKVSARTILTRSVRSTKIHTLVVSARFPHAFGARGKSRPVVVVQADVLNQRLRHAVVVQLTLNLDDKTDPANPVVLEKGLTWAPGLVKEYPYSLTHGGTPGTCTDHTNTAVVDLPTGTDPTDSTTVTVCVEKPLAAAATAGADLARAYAWSIDKVADATERTVDPETGTATFRYTVTVRVSDGTSSVTDTAEVRVAPR